MSSFPHLRLFGIPELLDADGHAVKLRTRKQLALLVFLTLEARTQPVTRERLVDLLWPGPDAKGLQSLSQALSEIRNKWLRDAFITNRASVQLRTALLTDLDLRDFKALPDPLLPPLEGLENCAGALFAAWVTVARERILTLIGSRLSRDLKQARSEGRMDTARARAEQIYSLASYNEVAMQVLLEERVLSGDRHGALLLCRKRIKDLEADPTASPQMLVTLRRFERALMYNNPVSSVDVSKLPDEPQRPDVFVGRESQLNRLNALCREVSNGAFRTCEIRGPDGIGKSTLLHRFSLLTTARGIPGFTVCCQEIGANIPYAAVSDLLDQMLRDSSVGATDRIWLAEASRIAPGIPTRFTGIAEPPEAPPEAVRVRLGEAIKNMLEAVADGGPMFLVFDDMHYMDPASREVLHLLARRLMGTPTLLVGAVRWSESGRTLGGGEILKAVDWQERINVSALNDDLTAELVTTFSTADEHLDEQAVRKIVKLAQGNPLLAEMLVSDWDTSGAKSLVMFDARSEKDEVSWSPPDTLNSVLARQYEGLSNCAERLVRLLATAGRSMPSEDFTRLLAVSPASFGNAVYTLMERGIVSLDGNALGFRNDLHREYVYSEMSKETRKYQHAHLAQHLSAAQDQNEFQHGLEASHHYLKAGWISEATELACNGAERAITCGAPQEAVKALEAVIAVAPDKASSPLKLFLAHALTAVGQYGNALNTLAAWQPAHPTQYEAALAATVRVEALHRGRLDDDTTIKQALEHAINLTEKSGVDSLFVSALQLCAEWASETGDSQALDSVRATTKRIGQSSTHAATKTLARLSQGYCLLVDAEVKQAETEFRECIGPLSDLRLYPELRRVYNGIGIACYCLGSMDRSASAFERAIDIATRIGDSIAAATSWSNLGVVHEDLGNFDRAQECYEQALSLVEKAANPRRAVEFNLNAAGLKLVRGDLTGARHSISIAHGWAEESKLWWLKADVLLAEADTSLAGKKPDLTWSLLKEAERAMMGRTYALSNVGRYERLRRHHTFVTEGLSEMLRLSEADDFESRCVQITDRLEVRAFEEWARMTVNPIQGTSPSHFEELEARGLVGVLRRLEVLGYSRG